MFQVYNNKIAFLKQRPKFYLSRLLFILIILLLEIYIGLKIIRAF